MRDEARTDDLITRNYDSPEPYDSAEPYDGRSDVHLSETVVREWLKGWFDQQSGEVSVATIARNLGSDPEEIRPLLSELAQKGAIQVIEIPETPEDFLTVTGVTPDEARGDGGS